MRKEIDTLGEFYIPKEKYFGIHTARALLNFPNSRLPQYAHFYKALAQVKSAAALTNLELGYLTTDIGEAIMQALAEILQGKYLEDFVIDPLQGGAGTSVNMNINELIANRATEILGGKKGQYLVDPLTHVNLHQSTNDIYPTAVHLAVYYFLIDLEQATNNLLLCLQEKEKEFTTVIKLGRTQLQAAVPCTLGQEFSAYADMIGRDRWRIFKCQERIRQINLGGTAIGTGIGAPRNYILKVSEKLKQLTGLPLARAENLFDATQNHDQLAEVLGMLKVLALDLGKLANDLRLMAGFGELQLPHVQMGSSIMPGKYNPVIPEMVCACSKKIIGNELSSALALTAGELELNAFLPLAAYATFESCDLLIQSIRLLQERAVEGLSANEDICRQHLLDAPSATAILLPRLDYHQAQKVAEYMHTHKLSLPKAVQQMNVLTENELAQLLTPAHILGLGHG